MFELLQGFHLLVIVIATGRAQNTASIFEVLLFFNYFFAPFHSRVLTRVKVRVDPRHLNHVGRGETGRKRERGVSESDWQRHQWVSEFCVKA